MVQKEVYLKFGNRNKAISFENKAGISDWNTLREVIQRVSEKDEDLKKRLQNCTNIIFQKYKIKKSTGEKILVDVDEDEELEVENDADLTVVFCYFQNILLNSESPNQIKDIASSVVSQDHLIFNFTNDTLESHETFEEIENNLMIIHNANVENAELINKENREGNREQDKEENMEQDQSTNSEMSTMKTSKNVLKRKFESTQMKPQKVHYSLFLNLFIFFFYI